MIEARARTTTTGAWPDVVRACRRIPPLWDLNNYVAVNPFLGFADTPLARAAREIGDGLGARVLPPLEYYRERRRDGAFGPDDLAGAAARAGRDAGEIAAILDGVQPAPTRQAAPVLSFAERLDRAYGGGWEDAVVRQVARWCAVFALGGGSGWALPDDGRGLFASWREASRVDRTPEILGLAGWRRWVGDLPETAGETIDAMLARLGVARHGRGAYLYHLLGGVFGWASFFRRTTWSHGDEDPGAVADLLAIRVAADAAVAELAPRPRRSRVATAPTAGGAAVVDESVRLAFQEALEDGFARRLLGSLKAPEPRRPRPRPEVQAVFCIDVRSEPLRRHLEAQSGTVETLGFAGFFGVPLDWNPEAVGGARCPVQLRPSVTIRPRSASVDSLKAAGKRLQGAPAAAFTFVEVLGLAYGLGLAADALAVRAPSRPPEESTPITLDADGQGGGIPLASRVELAESILKNMGPRAPFARLVMLCGHEGRSANNPHAAGLDCGACGGHGGALNARVAAALLNDPAVRDALRTRGRVVPDDTVFVPAVHQTTTDEITLLDVDRIAPSHREDLDRLRGWLDAAADATRAERAPALGLGGRPAGMLRRLLRHRSRDWSEVRPEWGLARNAAFLAARRERTRGVDLGGRAFLHEYDAANDPDDAILALVLTAPVVVASWINLQYFASTVDNRAFGCGTKTLHNRVGTLGVVLGNGGDLRTGLPLQSVHAADGRWFHEPLRLQVVVEAEPRRIDAVLDAHPGVRQLVDNGWIRLFALEPEGSGAALRLPSGAWEPVAVAAVAPAVA